MGVLYRYIIYVCSYSVIESCETEEEMSAITDKTSAFLQKVEAASDERDQAAMRCWG